MRGHGAPAIAQLEPLSNPPFDVIADELKLLLEEALTADRSGELDHLRKLVTYAARVLAYLPRANTLRFPELLRSTPHSRKGLANPTLVAVADPLRTPRLDFPDLAPSCPD